MRDVLVPTAAFLSLYLMLAVPAMSAAPVGVSYLESLAPSLLLAGGLASLSAVDLHERRLPDALTLPLAGAGLALAWWTGQAPLWWHAVSAVIGFVLLAAAGLTYHSMRGRAGLGLGDAKLFGAAGSWVGMEGLPTVLLWACVAAIAAVLVFRGRAGKLTRTTTIAFGPFLALGTWLVWLYGPI